MLPVIGLFALAGALVGGGIGGGYVAIEAARAEAAREISRRDRQAVREALEQECDLAELRQRATGLGLDPAAVEAGYWAYRSRQISLDQLISSLNLMA